MGRLIGRVLNLLEATLGDNDKPPASKEASKDVEQPYAGPATEQPVQGIPQPAYGAYAEPQPVYDRPTGRKGRQERKAQRQAEKQHLGVNEFSGMKQRFVGLFYTLNREKRAGLALKVAMAWGASVIMIGIIFTILCATGTFPASVSDMKAGGIYVPYQVKYALYVVMGIATMAGVIMVYKAVRNSKSPWWGLFVLWTALFLTLATIGITIYLLVKDAKINSAWWAYLIQALILVLRIALLLSIVAALVAVHEALKDDWTREEMIAGRY